MLVSFDTKNRRLADEDDELSEVQPDAVPPEVREWLASTFTRQLATTRKKSDEKPKFRSVAHAIRAGIFVDRIYRRVSSTALMQFPPEVVKVLKVNVWRNFPCVLKKNKERRGGSTWHTKLFFHSGNFFKQNISDRKVLLNGIVNAVGCFLCHVRE